MGRLLTWTTDYLRQRGSDSPQLDAQLLLAHARQCRRIDLFTSYRRRRVGRGAERIPRTGAPAVGRDARRVPDWYTRVLLARVPRHTGRADPAAGNRVRGAGAVGSGQGPSRPGRVAGHRRRGNRQRHPGHVRRPARAAVLVWATDISLRGAGCGPRELPASRRGRARPVLCRATCWPPSHPTCDWISC